MVFLGASSLRGCLVEGSTGVYLDPFMAFMAVASKRRSPNPPGFCCLPLLSMPGDMMEALNRLTGGREDGGFEDGATLEDVLHPGRLA